MGLLNKAQNTGKVTQVLNKWRSAVVEEERDHTFIHASEVGGCPVAVTFGRIKLSSLVPGQQGMKEAKVLRIFDLGTAIHQVIQRQCVAAGIVPTLNGLLLVEVLLRIQALNVGGSADIIVEIDGKRYVVEIKSINSNAWNKLAEPQDKHKIQGAAYLVGAKEAKIVDADCDTVIFLYYAKDTSEIKEFWYKVTPKDVADLKSKAATVDSYVKKFEETGELPKACYDNPNKPPCRWCDWSGVCFDAMHRHTVQKAVTNAVAQKAQGKDNTSKRKPPSRLKARSKGR